MAYTEAQLEHFKTSLPQLYHRTFMSDHTDIENTKKLLKKSGEPQLATGRSTYRAPSMSAVDSPAGKSRIRVAYYTDGSQLYPTRIWVREGQNFDAYATPWEKWWSQFFSSRHDSFTPIVDMSDTLIGHYGRVSSEKILARNVPAGHRESSFSDAYWGYDLLVGNGDAEKTSGYSRALDTFAFYTVQTGIDGNVTSGAFAGPSNNGEATPVDVSPLDLAAAGQILFSLATVITKVGARAALSIERKMLVRQAARQEATLAGKTAVGMAVSTGRILPARHLGRRTIIMGEDLEKFTGLMAPTRTEEGLYDIVIHGDSITFQILVKEGNKKVWKNVSASDVANVVRPQLAAGDQIRLLACKVGNTGGPAQQLATELNRTVWAPSTTVRATPKTAFGRQTFVPLNDGKFFEFLP